MATASELKVKVTKILTIVEYLDDEHINVIEKDLLLQAVRELYSDILLTGTDESASKKPLLEEEKEVVEEVPAEEEEKTSEPPIIAIPFDAGDFDFSNLMDIDTGAKEQEASENNVVDDSESNVSEEINPEILNESSLEESTEDAQNFGDEVNSEELDKEIEPEVFVEPETDSVETNEPENVAVVEPNSVEETLAEPVDSNPNDEFKSEPVAGENDYVMQEAEVEEAAEAYTEKREEPTDGGVSYSYAQTTTEEQNRDVVAPKNSEATMAGPSQVNNMESMHPNFYANEVRVTSPIEERTEHVNVEPEKSEQSRLTLGEQLGQSRQESLNDRFANYKPIDLSSQIGQKPISDIRSSIGLGERYRFTRSLFDGNGILFDATVRNLNEMSSIEEAENYVRTNFNWDMDSSVVADFMNIVRRRYL